MREAVGLEVGEREIVPAPVDRGAGEIAAGDTRVDQRPIADHAAAAAAEVENRAELVDAGSGPRERGADRLRGKPAALEKPADVRCAGDPDDQVRRRYRQ